jgi:hypothetical protein
VTRRTIIQGKVNENIIISKNKSMKPREKKRNRKIKKIDRLLNKYYFNGILLLSV